MKLKREGHGEGGPFRAERVDSRQPIAGNHAFSFGFRISVTAPLGEPHSRVARHPSPVTGILQRLFPGAIPDFLFTISHLLLSASSSWRRRTQSGNRKSAMGGPSLSTFVATLPYFCNMPGVS